MRTFSWQEAKWSQKTNPAFQQILSSVPDLEVNADSGGPMGEEAVNGPNVHLQEKFHRGILGRLRNISDTP